MDKELDINFIDVFLYVLKNLKLLIIVFISIFMLGLCLILSFTKFYNSSHTSKYTIAIENTAVQKYLTPYYIINKENFTLASKKSNFSKINVTNEFLSSFTIIPGESNSNKLIDYLNQDDFNTLAKTIAVQPEFLDEYFKEINAHSLNYKTIIINRSGLSLSKEEIDIFISNLIEVVNENLNNDFNLAPVMLSNLVYLNENKSSTFAQTIYMKEYIDTLKYYLSTLLEFSRNTELINLNQLEDKLLILELQFNDYLSSKSEVSDFIIQKNNILIASLDRQITSLKEIINSFDESSAATTSESIGSNESFVRKSSENIMFDNDSFSKILEIGNQLSSVESKIKYTDLLYEKNMKRLSLLEQNEGLNINNKKFKILSISDFDRMNLDITNDINKYLNSLKEVSKYSQSIKLLSDQVVNKKSTFTQIRQSLLLLFLFTATISITSILVKGSLRGYSK